MTTQTKTPNKRSRLFIDRHVQGALIRRMTLHYAVFFVVFCFVAAALRFLANPMESIATHFNELWMTQGPFFLVFVVLAPAFLYDTVKLSHRFVGPVARIRTVMKAAAAGHEYQNVTLRPRDYWSGLADDVNLLLGELETAKAALVDKRPEEADGILS